MHYHSDYRPINQSLIEPSQFVFYQVFTGWQTIERNLGEQMMFSLVLHASHQQQPEKIFVCIVSAAYELVIDVRHLGILSKSDFSFMVSNQHVS
jgi:hypothetical protein